MAEHACDEVEVYMGMVVEAKQTFEGLIEHLKMLFSLGRLWVNWSVISMVMA